MHKKHRTHVRSSDTHMPKGRPVPFEEPEKDGYSEMVRSSMIEHAGHLETWTGEDINKGGTQAGKISKGPVIE